MEPTDKISTSSILSALLALLLVAIMVVGLSWPAVSHWNYSEVPVKETQTILIERPSCAPHAMVVTVVAVFMGVANSAAAVEIDGVRQEITTRQTLKQSTCEMAYVGNFKKGQMILWLPEDARAVSGR